MLTSINPKPTSGSMGNTRYSKQRLIHRLDQDSFLKIQIRITLEIFSWSLIYPSAFQVHKLNVARPRGHVAFDARLWQLQSHNTDA